MNLDLPYNTPIRDNKARFARLRIRALNNSLTKNGVKNCIINLLSEK